MHPIRRLNPGEAAIYRTIRLDALRDSPDAFATTHESALARDEASWIAQADAAAEGDDRAIFLLWNEDRPAGLAALYRDPGQPSTGDLLQMWITPVLRGGSAASELLGHLFHWAATREFTAIRAEVTAGNLRALRFYQKQGFAPLPSEAGRTLLTIPVGPRHSAV